MKTRADYDHLTLGAARKCGISRPATNGWDLGLVRGIPGAMAAMAVIVRGGYGRTPFPPTFMCVRLPVIVQIVASALRRKATAPICDVKTAGVEPKASNFAARDYHQACDKFLPSILALKTPKS